LRDIVLRFIERFTNSGTKEEVIDIFTNGCCYWFAKILFERFADSDFSTHVVYDEVANHFGCYIDGAVYDITGDITDKYTWRSWYDVNHTDKLHAERISRDCIYF
jgi:hypothetical protein